MKKLMKKLFGEKPPKYEIFVDGRGKYVIYYGGEWIPHRSPIESLRQCEKIVEVHNHELWQNELIKVKEIQKN